MMSVPRFTFGLLSQTIVSGSIQFIAPSLSLHLSAYGYQPEFISICFGIPAILYATASPLMFLLTAKFPKRTVINMGTVLMAVGMFFIGTSDILGAENDADFILGGLCLVGLSAGMMAIPIMPEMLESIEQRPEFGYDTEEVTNETSSLFVVCIGLGEAIAPIAASMLLA
jgi:MFS family permease